MVSKEQIDRINALAKKAKREGLSAEEKEEQQMLRRLYIDSFKENLRAQLDQIEFVEQVEKKEGRGKDQYVVELEEEMHS